MACTHTIHHQRYRHDGVAVCPKQGLQVPNFQGPDFHWTPDLNYYGVASIGLQEQLIQRSVGNDIRLLAARTMTWDARFKAWAPHNTTIQGTVEARKMQKLAVLPKSLEYDVIIERNNRIYYQAQIPAKIQTYTGTSISYGLAVKQNVCSALADIAFPRRDDTKLNNK
ncbi:hypothetical protein ACHAQD_009886 [Fusarium lateritium]